MREKNSIFNVQYLDSVHKIIHNYIRNFFHIYDKISIFSCLDFSDAKPWALNQGRTLQIILLNDRTIN